MERLAAVAGRTATARGRRHRAGAIEVARALKPGGRFYVAEDHETYEMAGHTAEQVASTLREAGFELGEAEVFREGDVVFDLFCAVNPG